MTESKPAAGRLKGAKSPSYVRATGTPESRASQFTARSMLEHPESWKPFTALLARRGRARITVLAVLEHMGRVAGRFSGQFVAFGNDGKSGA